MYYICIKSVCDMKKYKELEAIANNDSISRAHITYIDGVEYVYTNENGNKDIDIKNIDIKKLVSCKDVKNKADNLRHDKENLKRFLASVLAHTVRYYNPKM